MRSGTPYLVRVCAYLQGGSDLQGGADLKRGLALTWLLAICAGNSPVPTQRPVTRSFDAFFDNGSLVNSLARGRPGCRFKTAISNLVFLLVSSHQLRIMLWDECQGTSPMMSQQWFKVMDWCRQATSHYPSQCWPSSMSYGVTKTQWVNPQFKWHAWVGTYPTNH